MGRVFVDNRNEHHAQQCRAADGQTTQVPANARKAPIDEKFTWAMPPDVILSKSNIRTFETAEQIKVREKEETAARQREEEAATKATSINPNPEQKDK